jgi:hypothetical protein
MAGDLINRTACREFALRWTKEQRRGWEANQVARGFLDDLNTRVRLMIQGAIQRHPTKGKTIRYLQ